MEGQSPFVDGSAHGRSIMTPARISNDNFSTVPSLARRQSGILLHPTSLPSPFGIGDFGAEARAFVDFLHGAGQTLWQTLPLGPTGYGNSPYQALSAFAGNTLLIDQRALVDDGLLETNDVAEPM